MGRNAEKNDSLPGSLDMVILKKLSRGKFDGYVIAQAILSSPGEEILIEVGSLYPALRRLRENGWIDGEWGATPTGRRARIYKITPEGWKQLVQETDRYRQPTLAIAHHGTGMRERC